MKANEAPERVYLSKNIFSTYLYQVPDPDDETAVEYIRTDAVIEKACDAYCAICDTKECDGCAECTWVIKFRRQLLKY